MYPYRKHWMKHTAMVPKGFIRYQVLESLNEKPMSGSEIIERIKSRTDGRWKPSPGSIYPLLAWLQDDGHIKELPTGRDGMKRYELTDSGRALLNEQKKIVGEQWKIVEEQRKAHMKFRKHGMFFGPPFLRAPWFRLPSEKTEEMHKSVRHLARAFFELGSNLEAHFSGEVIEQAREVLDEAAGKLQELSKKLTDEGHE